MPFSTRGTAFHADDQLTPLFMSAHNGNKEVVELLLQHGAALDAASDKGVTPLLAAVHHGYVKVSVMGRICVEMIDEL